MRSRTTSGRSSQARNSRPPIGVMVRSISCRSDPWRPPSVDSTTSRCFSVVGSISSVSDACLTRMRADVRQLRLLRVAQVAHQRAGRGDRRLAALEPEAVETAHAQLVEQRLPRALQVEVPAVHLGDRQLQARDLGNGGSHVVPARHHDLARTEHRNLVAERLQAFGATVLGDVEFAGREIEQRDAVLDGALVRA